MKKKILVLPVLVLSLLLSGCNYQAIIDKTVHDIAHLMTDPEDVVEPFIGFAETEPESTEQLRQLTPEELQNYTSRYSDYNTYTYFTHLNDTEKLLYRAYEYALDEALPYFWVDERLLQDMERTADEVLEFLTLDSAVVEQNYYYTLSGCTMTHTVWDIETSSESYIVVFVENFDRTRLQQKEEAIQKAKQILSGLTENGTPTSREAAEYFYDYLGQNVTYETDIEGKGYLYTALCEGRTNCDGYTNAFALLCAMAEIPCIEINSDTPEDEIGHTWNAVFLEDRWVHVDATGAVDDVTSENENCREERLNFGFPDALLEDRIEYADLIPTCPEGLTPILHIASGEIEDFNARVEAAFKENDRKVAVILVDEGDLENRITEDLADKLDCDLYSIYYETADGKMVYYLLNDD